MSEDPCTTMHLLLQAELDGELDAAGAAALAAHLRTCAGCAALREDLARLSSDLRGGLTHHTASPALRRSIRPRRAAALRWGHAASFGAGLALAAAIAGIAVLPGRGERASLPPDIVAAHIRALQPGHLFDVASTDQHTVKPWFDGRLDYAPPVRNLAADGFPLVGGRLDYIGGRPVAVLVYRRDRHLIDLFVWPGDRPGPDGMGEGYSFVGWTAEGMVFRAVSDVSSADLSALRRLWLAAG